MPRDKQEIAALALDALNRRDLDELPDFIDSEFEFYSRLAAIEGEVYRGLEGMREYFDDVDSTWNEFRVELEEFHDLGERSALVIRARGIAKASGVPLDQRLGQLWTWRGEKIRHVDAYADPAEAFRAAGLP